MAATGGLVGHGHRRVASSVAGAIEKGAEIGDQVGDRQVRRHAAGQHHRRHGRRDDREGRRRASPAGARRRTRRSPRQAAGTAGGAYTGPPGWLDLPADPALPVTNDAGHSPSWAVDIGAPRWHPGRAPLSGQGRPSSYDLGSTSYGNYIDRSAHAGGVSRALRPPESAPGVKVGPDREDRAAHRLLRQHR